MSLVSIILIGIKEIPPTRNSEVGKVKTLNLFIVYRRLLHNIFKLYYSLM